jgi:hypothetical protein
MDGSLIRPDEIEFVLQVIEVMTSALEGDGSTDRMPDCTPDEAARYVYGALNSLGYQIIKRQDF